MAGSEDGFRKLAVIESLFSIPRQDRRSGTTRYSSRERAEAEARADQAEARADQAD